MIILFNKLSGEIYGMVGGRVHSDHDIATAMIRPSTVPVEEVDKYLVSYKRLTKMITEDILEDQVDRKTFKIIKDVKVGEREVEVGDGMEIDDQFKDFFTAVEDGTINLYDHKFILDDSSKVIDVVKK